MSSIKQKCLSVLRVLDDLDGLQKITDFSQEIQFFKNRLEDNEFRIAVVGEYSSGKSTFINALLLGQKQWAEREKAAQVQRLGTRPRAEERTEYYTDLVYRGGWGILDRLFGPKEVRRPKIVRDDSAGQAWDREKAKIQNTFIGTIANLERQRNAALRAAERAKGDTTAAVQRREMARNRVNELEEKIQWEKKVLEENKKKAAAEFLAFYKRDLCKQVQDYLICGDNSVLNQMIEGIKEELLQVRKDFIPWAIQLFEQALNQKLAWIEQVRLQNSPTIFQETQEWSNLRSRVENLRQELEEIL